MNLSNLIPRYSSPWVALIFFALSFGYAKLPFTSIPLGAIVLLIDWRNLMRLCRTNVGKLHLLLCIAFLIYFFVRMALEYEAYDLRTFSFILILLYKSFIGLYFASVLVYLMIFKSELIGLYIFIQVVLMVSSAFNEDIYQLLLHFQTAEARAVFGDIFSQRSIGFGLVHNEGVVLILLLYVTYIEFQREKSIVINFFLGFLMYLCGFSSRLILVLLPFWHFLKSAKLLISIILLAAISVVYLDVRDGPLSQIFEIYNYYEDYGEIGTRSTNAISDMNFLPDNFSTWIVGDGLFYQGSEFYKNTDIGLARIIFYGGLLGSLFYISIFFWPLFIMAREIFSMHSFFILFVSFVYVASNVKGIVVQSFPLIFIFIYHYVEKYCKSKSGLT